MTPKSKNHPRCPYPVGECVCPMPFTGVPREFDRMVDKVLAYKPKPKTKAAKRRARKKKRDAKIHER